MGISNLLNWNLLLSNPLVLSMLHKQIPNKPERVSRPQPQASVLQCFHRCAQKQIVQMAIISD